MNQDTESIVKAIESLKPASNIFKDYLFPIVSAFFSSLLGAGVAYFSFHYQERLKIEKDKMNAANQWTLIAEGALSSLIAIKANYHGKLTEDPIQRAFQIPTILGSSKPIAEELTVLSFVVPKSNRKSNSNPKWSQLPLIRTMIINYNCLLEIWEERNLRARPIREKVMQRFPNKALADINIDQIAEITECVGIINLLSLIDLTEKIIKLTDDIIVELSDFLLNFPKLAKSLIKKDKLKKYGSIIEYNNENILEFIIKSPEVNYLALSKVFGQSPEEIKKRYQTGYE